jgi:capsular polysaccharide biosynthesis protein
LRVSVVNRLGPAFAASLRWWRVVVLGLVIAVAAGVLVSAVAAKNFEATAWLLVGPAGAQGADRAAGRSAVSAYGGLFTQAQFLQLTSSQIPGAPAPSALRSSIKVQIDKSARLIEVVVHQPDPRIAASIANGLARLAVETIQRSGVDEARQLILLEPARPDSSPLGPSPAAVGLASGAAGAAAAYLLIMIAELMTPAVRRPADLARFGYPYVGTARTRPPWRFAAESGHPAGPVGYESITDRLIAVGFLKRGSTLFFFGVTSADDSAEVAVNISLTLALRGQPSVVHGLHERLDSPERRSGTAIDGAGPHSAGPSWRATAAQLADRAGTKQTKLPKTGPSGSSSQVALLHAGPPSTSEATAIGSRSADAAVLVVRRFETRERDVESATEACRRAGSPVEAVILFEPN